MTVYDCFTFFQEVDLLELRLRELSGPVDRFVIVEATRTHKGDARDLVLPQHAARFAPWADRIVYVPVDDLPDGDTPASIWRREMAQRNAITRGLAGAAPDDVVLISDVDEIPRRGMIPRTLPDDVLLIYEQTLHYYDLNTRCTSLTWKGTRATQAQNVIALTPDGVRYDHASRGGFPQLVRIARGGWHFSYFGGVAAIQNKLGSFLHQELVNADTSDPAAIAARVAAAADVYGRDGQQFTIGPADDLPLTVLRDPMAWRGLFRAGWEPQFTEDWYDGDQALFVGYLAQRAPEGLMVEIGCWEGRSTAVLAQAIAPRVLHCVDTWRGNEAEGDDHPSVIAARARDVLGAFVCNMERITGGNWTHHVRDWRDWITGVTEPIAFVHIDAAHDYASVADCLTALLPLLAPGAILCGDDYYGDGVQRAVCDVLGNHDTNGRLWLWQAPTP